MNAEASLLVVPSKAEMQGILGKESVEDDSIEWFFPKLDPGRKPLGKRVIVQLRRTKTKSKGGIELVQDTKETERWNDQVAMVVELGPLAYKNKTTLEPWPEGAWVKPGDFVSVPRWGGDRWNKKIGDEKEQVTFAMFNEDEIISIITDDPTTVVSFIL